MNLPGTPFYRMLRDAETLERGILDWVAEAGQDSDGKDFLSILISSPDADGNPGSAAQVAAQIPILLVAPSETCENALIWTLVMLDQHPRIAADLLDELRGRLAGSAPTPVGDLPLLDAVIKESMRLLPPGPLQFRTAQRDTALAGYPMPRRSAVVLSAFLTNRNRDLFPDPDHQTRPLVEYRSVRL
jgi:cytochrome P450